MKLQTLLSTRERPSQNPGTECGKSQKHPLSSISSHLNVTNPLDQLLWTPKKDSKQDTAGKESY